MGGLGSGAPPQPFSQNLVLPLPPAAVALGQRGLLLGP